MPEGSGCADDLSGYSYPSAHVVHYVAFYGRLGYLASRRLGASPPPADAVRRALQSLLAVCCALVVLVGPSRVFLGAHWPSDVIAAVPTSAYSFAHSQCSSWTSPVATRSISLLGVVPVLVYSGVDSTWRWLSAAAAEALLWAVYGTLLGLMYPIFNAYRRSKQGAM